MKKEPHIRLAQSGGLAEFSADQIPRGIWCGDQYRFLKYTFVEFNSSKLSLMLPCYFLTFRD